MKQILVSLFILIGSSSHAQQQTFDITTYTPPKGWKANLQQNVMVYSIVDNVKKTWAQIGLYSSTASKGSIESDFTSEWNELAVKQYKATGLETNDALTANDWKVKAGGGKFRYNNADAIIMLTTMTGYNVCVSILATTNSQDYLDAIKSFLETVDLKKPSGNLVNNKPVTQNSKPVLPGNFTFTTTNFNDGWNSTVYEDYVLAAKGNIKVYLSFIEKFNASEFTGTGKEARFHYWDTWVSKYFTTGDKKFQTASALSDYSENYIEGWAIDKQTGERRYIGMILNIIAYTGTLSIIVASAPDAAQLRQQFPKADQKYPNDLLTMYSYNKFAVGKSDLPGTWSSNGGGTVSWYSTTTGQYAGATGAAMSDRFIFNTNGTYSSEHKGGYGVVGSMNVYQQKYNGAYTVSNWQVTASKRWEGKTENFNAWFEIVTGGRVLHLDAGGGKSYTLYKEK